MSNKNSKNMLICAIVFFVAALFCVMLFFLYDYFAVPEIKLVGEEEVVLILNNKYEDEGAVATLDNIDISDQVKVSNKVDEKKVGNYQIIYSVTNTKGKQERKVIRKVWVRDDVNPELSLKGSNPYKTQYGSDYKDPGYVAHDNYDGDITSKVKISGKVDIKKIGDYKLYYTVSDSSQNSVTKIRDVKVVDTEAPKLTINGNAKTQIKFGADYKDEGCTAIDNYDGDISSKVKASSTVNLKIAGVYKIKYTVSDSFGNTATATRTVQVGTQADIDNANYIIVSISGQSLRFYRHGVLQLSTSVVTGTRGVNDTPRGSFRLQWKARNVYLRGPDYKTFVNYWMPIYGDIGLHDATWRSSFGGGIYYSNGSHGCINLPYWAAQSIYYNAPTGILVKVV